MFKPEQFSPDPQNQKREESLESNTETEQKIARLVQELRDENNRLKNMPDHGSGVGIIEMMDLAKTHPDILSFFENAPDVLGDIDIGRLTYLGDRFLTGKLNDKEFKDLEETYFAPYFEKVLGEKISN